MIMLAEHHSLVTCIDDQSIVLDTIVPKVVQNASYVFVNASDAPKIVLQVSLVGGTGLLLLIHAGDVQRSAWPEVVLHSGDAIANRVGRPQRASVVA